MKDLLISIVLYKTNINDLYRCINSIRKFKPEQKIIFIDNSPDKNLKKYLEHYEFTDYYHSKKNLGYGAGHNIAIRKSIKNGYKYHLVINADIYFETDVLNEMISYMDANENIGNMMPKIMNIDGSIQRLCKLIPNPLDLIKRIILKNPTRFEKYYEFSLKSFKYDKVSFIPYLSGCFMMLRISKIKKIGLFDERFFMYPEDLDLSRRIASRFDSVFFPKCKVFHKHNADSKKNLKMFLIHAINMIIYFNKWGWIFDRDRDIINQKTVNLLKNN